MATSDGPRHRLVIEGAAAAVRRGSSRAAELGAWRVEGDHFAAAIVRADAFALTQAGLVLEIPNRDGIPTRRALAEVVVAAGRLSARLLKRSEP